MSDSDDINWMQLVNDNNSSDMSDVEDPSISISRDDMLRRHMFNMEHRNMNSNSMEDILNNYLTNPSDTFTVHNAHIRELPNIITTFSNIKKLIIINCSLETLNNLPPNVESIDVSNNSITVINSICIPESVTEINLTKNNIQILDLSTSLNITTINLSNNPLSNILVLPPNVIDLNLSSTGIVSTDTINNLNSLQILKLNSICITNIDNLPDSILELSISRINMELGDGIINKLPVSLTNLVAHCAGIKRFAFEVFPSNLVELDVYDNELTELPRVPDRMEDIDISRNKLTRITNIPNTIEKYDSRMNEHLVYTQEQKNIIDNLKQVPWSNDIYIDDDDDDDIFNFVNNDENHVMDSKRENVFIDSMMNTRNINIMDMLNSRTQQNNIMDILQRLNNDNPISRLMGNDNFRPSKKNTHRIRHRRIYRI